MKYVYVASQLPTGGAKKDFTPATINQTELCLYSIIDGLKQKGFGLDTLLKVATDISEYRRRYIRSDKHKIFIDSGGYSIIRGDVPPEGIHKFIKCYKQYSKEYHHIFDYIFSLDIPLSLKYQQINNNNDIYNFNYESLRDSKELLQEYPILREKFYLVWQFKILPQYEIWRDIIDELQLNSLVQNRAIGGMVGLKERAKLDFSPFTAIAFRCLKDYLTAESSNFDFRLHFFGIYTRSDRFHIEFLEQLFDKYFNGNFKAELTYDSIQYKRAAHFNVKQLEVFSLTEDGITSFPDIRSVPGEILQEVYFGEMYEWVQEEIANLNRRIKLANIDTFTPLNIYSNLALDKFFGKIIKQYDLVNLFYNCQWGFELESVLKKICSQLAAEHHEIFTESLLKSIINNLKITFKFHQWYLNNQDYSTLDELIKGFIKMIDFPLNRPGALSWHI